MSLTIPPGYASVAYEFSSAYGTQPFITTIGLDISAFPGSATDIADWAFAGYQSTLLPLTHNDLTLDRVVASIGQDGPGGSVESTVASQPGGKASSTDGAAAMAPILRKVTAELGRAGRGRMFIPGVMNTNDVYPNGQVADTLRGNLDAAAADFVETLSTTSPGLETATPPVLLHSGPAIPSEILELKCAPLVGWIRGRIR